jgi:hypothetical protein
MARASWRLIGALRETAARLGRADTVYRWSQLAHCNCGHLAQTITGLPPREIHEAASRQRGDWAEQAHTAARRWTTSELDYGSRPALDEGAWEPDDLGHCPIAELGMSQIFAELAAWGLEPSDVGALERLDDPEVRRRLGTHTTDFLHSDRENVIAYLSSWADLLEERLEPTRAHGGGDAPSRSPSVDDAAFPVAAE